MVALGSGDELVFGDDVPNEPSFNDRPAARTVEAPMLQPSLGLDPDRFSLLKKPLR